MIENINEMSPNLKYFDVYTSLESVGEQAEYSRDGINYKEFIDNCYKVLDNTPKSYETVSTVADKIISPVRNLLENGDSCEISSI